MPLDYTGLEPLSPDEAAAPAEPVRAPTQTLDYSGLEPMESETFVPTVTPPPVEVESQQPLGAPEENTDISRSRSAAASFVQGVGRIASAIPQEMAIGSVAGRRKVLDVLDRIDKGEPFTPLEGGYVPSSEWHRIERYQNGDAEERAKIRAFYGVRDPRESELYKTGEQITKFLQETFPTNPQYKDDFWTTQVPQGLGTTVGFYGLGLLTGGAGLSGGASAALLGSAVQGASQFQDALQHGSDIEQAISANAYGLALGTTEGVPVAALFNRINRATGGLVSRAIREAAIQGTEEAVQEAFQTIGENAVAAKIIGYDPERGLFTGSGSAAGVGATSGGIMGFLAALILPGKQHGTIQPPPLNVPTAVQEPQSQPTLDPEKYLTDEDRTSPLPDDLIAEGRAIVAGDPAMEPLPAPPNLYGESPAGVSEGAVPAETLIGIDEEASPLDTVVTPAPAAPTSESPLAPVLEGEAPAAPETAPEAAAEPMPIPEVTPPPAPVEALDYSGLEPVEPIRRTDASEIVDQQAAQAEPEPTEAQKEAGNYRKGHIAVHGLDVSIENAKGSTRRGKDASGEEWSIEMPSHYGYIRRTEGADGEQVDVYVGDNPESDQVYVVDQYDADSGRFDEHKAMLGFNSQQEAEVAYDAAFSDGRGPERRRSVTPMSVEKFREMLNSENWTQPAITWSGVEEGAANDQVGRQREVRGDVDEGQAPVETDVEGGGAGAVAGDRVFQESGQGDVEALDYSGLVPDETTAETDVLAAPVAEAETRQPEQDIRSDIQANTEDLSAQPAAQEIAAPITRRDIAPDTAVTSSGREVPVQYAVVDARDLVASQTDNGQTNSAYPAELQPRDRSRGVSQQQVQSIAQNLNPRLLDRSPKASDGAPIVSDAGIVESGNARTLAIRKAYAEGLPSAQTYRDYLAQQGYPVEGVDQPVLVRVRSGELAAQDRQAFTREANARDTLDMSATERAMADAKALPAGVLDLYRGGDIDLAQNRDFVRRFLDSVVPETERAGMVAEDGTLSQDAVRRVQGALFAKAYDDAGLVGDLMESTDTNIKAIGGALMDVAPQWAQMRADAQAGNIDSAMDTTDRLIDAVKLVQRARREGRNLAEYVNQKDIFTGDTIDVETELFLGLMFRNKQNWTSPAGRAKMAEALQFYVGEAQKTTQGVDLLGETAPPPARIIETAQERQYGRQGQPQQQELAAQPARSSGKRERPNGGAGQERSQPAAQQAPDRQGAAARAEGTRSERAVTPRTASWIIRNKETGEVIAETFDRKKVDALNTAKYEAVPVLDYLGDLNQQIKTAGGKQPNRLVIETGVVLRTKTGRLTSPAPKIEATTDHKTQNSIRRMNEWLLAEAKKEPVAPHVKPMLEGMNPARMTQADQDTVNLILFNDPEGPTEANVVAEKPAPEAGSSSQAEAPLRIEDYSAKSIIIRGQTKENIDRIKAVPGARPLWNRKAKGWIFPKKREAAVREALADLLGEGPAPAAVTAPAPQKAPEPSGPTPAEQRAAKEEQAQQKAAKKLRDVAEKMIAKAEEDSGRDRQVNTARRASMAASAEADAARRRAMGVTLRNIADAMERGEAGPLATVRSKAQVETLDSELRQAMYESDRALSYPEQEKRKGRSPEEADLKNVNYPWPTVHGVGIGDVIKALKSNRGFAQLQRRVTRDRLMRFNTEGQVETLEKLLAAGKKQGVDRYDLERIAEPLKRFKRVRAMGINSKGELQDALRKLMELRGQRKKADPIKEAERALIGRKIPGFFQTPESLAQRMVDEAEVKSGQTILEPSAGAGRIADAIAGEIGNKAIDTIEPVTDLQTILKAKGYPVVGTDFLESDQHYDRILMNPPFENGQDMDHVMHAYELLNPGGRLVSIMSEGPFFRADKKATAFRDWLEAVGGTSEQLPEGTFKESGTGVATRLVVVDKGRVPKGVAFAAAYHGSPHDFERFSTEKIGTGEGAQAYGWGLYFAGRQGVAEFYRDQLADKRAVFEIRGKGEVGDQDVIDAMRDALAEKYPKDYGADLTKEVDDPDVRFARQEMFRASINAYSDMATTGSVEGFLNAQPRTWRGSTLSEEYLKAHERIQDYVRTHISVEQKGGKLYHVDLTPAEDEYLYWDRPLSEQSEKVQDILHENMWAHREAHANQTGAEIYRELVRQKGVFEGQTPGDKAASLALKDAGIPGIKYLDQGSRNPGFSNLTPAELDARIEALETDIASGRGDQGKMQQQLASLKRERDTYRKQTYNYVIFDENAVSITAKYRLGNFKPEISSQADAIADDLHRRLARYGLSDKVALSVEDKIRATLLDGEQIAVAGQFDEVSRLMRVALEFGGADFTLDHESIHALKRLGLFRDAEWRAIEKAVRADTELMASIKERYGNLGLTDAQIVEEGAADLFARWNQGRSQPTGFLKSALRAIRAFFRAVHETLIGQGYRKAEDIFEAVRRGEVGRRGADEGGLTLSQEAMGVEYSIRDVERAGKLTEEEQKRRAGEALGFRDRLWKTISKPFSWYDPLGSLPGQREYLADRYRALGKIAKIEQVAQDLDKVFSGAPTEVQRQVYDYLTDRDAKPETIKDETVRNKAVATKRLMDRIGDALVEQGLLSEEAREAHRGEYLPRVYLKHLLDKGTIGLSGRPKTTDQGYLKARKDIPEEVRMLILGQITDPGYLTAIGYAKPVRDLAILDFLEKISRNKEWIFPDTLVEFEGRKVTAHYLKAEAERIKKALPHYVPELRDAARAKAEEMEQAALPVIDAAPEDPSLFNQVPDTKRYGALRGMFVREEIYDDVVGSSGWMPSDKSVASWIWGKATRANSLWKLSKVALNPPTQIRNFISNGVLLHLSGVSFHKVPVRITQAIKEMRTDGPHWKIAKEYGVTQTTFSQQEMARIERRLLRVKGGNRAWLWLKNAGAVVANTAGDTYAMSESIFKTAKIIDEMDRGATAEEAAIQAHKWLFDYSLVPPSIRIARQAPVGIPFATFQYKALPRMLEVAVKHPMRFAPYYVLPALFSLMVMFEYDVDNDDLDKLKKALPEWLQKRGNAFILPYKDSAGRWQYLDWGYMLPWGQLWDAGKSAAQGDVVDTIESFGVGGAPLTQLITAIQTNIDPFTKREIADPADPPAHRLAAWLSYLWRMTAPTWLTDIGAANKMLDAMGVNAEAPGVPLKIGGTGENYRGQPGNTIGQAGARFFGINIYPIDPEQSRDWNIRNMQKEIRDIRQRRQIVMKDRRLSREQRRERIDQYNEYLRDRIDQLEQYKKDSEVHPNLR